MNGLQTYTEQVGHRVRTITTGRRGRRGVTPEEIDNCVTYLDQVADHLEQHGLLVDAMTIDARKPVSARLAVKKESGEVIPGVGSAISLEWQRDFGWSTTTHGPGAPRDGWFHLYADDTASPGVVTEFVLNEVLPKDTPNGKPEVPGKPAVAS
ncbi:MAG TPA: hypothetical protein VHV74_04125 [Pseudonocardiaceae bacterium]|nr:hypothetical protein [Pseudonocardiaceae bacterium]